MHHGTVLRVQTKSPPPEKNLKTNKPKTNKPKTKQNKTKQNKTKQNKKNWPLPQLQNGEFQLQNDEFLPILSIREKMLCFCG